MMRSTDRLLATRGRVPAEAAAGDAESGDAESGDAGDAGRAIIEVVVLGVLVLIPVVYIMIALLRIQASTLAVNQAARDAGRAMDNAPSVAEGLQRAQQIAVISLQDQNVRAEGLSIRFVAPGSGCDGNDEVQPSLEPGTVYDICIRAVLTIPGVPSVLTGQNNTVTGIYTIHVGELREVR